jgi:PST family polysaccharide transporter
LGESEHGLLSRQGLAQAAQVYAAHLLRFVSPLLLYPILSRRLGLEGFGLYAAGLSLALMTSAVIEYGFAQSGPRDIVEAEPHARGRVVGTILAARLALTPLALLAGGALAWTNPVLRPDHLAVAAALSLGAAQGASVLWFFQGVRRPGQAAGPEVLGQGLAMLLIVLWPAASVGGVLAVQALGMGFGVAIGTARMVRQAPPVWPLHHEVRGVLREGLPLFISRGLIVGYTGASAFVVAALAGPAQAALYGVADRITAAAASFLRPLSGLVGPRISGLLRDDRDAAFRTTRWSLLLAPAAATVGAAVLAILSPWIIPRLFGEVFSPAGEVLRTLLMILPLVAFSQVLGPQLMTPLRMDGALALGVGIGCLATLVGALWLAPGGGAAGMAQARVLGEAAVVLACIVCLRSQWPRLAPAFWRTAA